jgi:hypothetical protein
MDDFYENQRIIERRKKLKQEAYNRASAQKLKKDIKKRLNTVMIGALAKFEEGFGELLDNNPELWEEVRKRVLDSGNHQIRMSMLDIDDYDIVLRKKYVQFYNPKFKGEER